MKKLFLLLAVLFFSFQAKANYISYYLIHTGIQNQLQEQKRQEKIKKNQVLVTGLEEENKGKNQKLKNKYEKIKGRLNNLNLLIDAFFISPNAIPAVKGIYENQKAIYFECNKHPMLIPLALESEIMFVKRTDLMVRFMAGLILSYGDVNQMKSSDRKKLLLHALSEIDQLWSITEQLIGTIRDYKMSWALKQAEWKIWKNQEKDIIKDIIKNAKDF